MNCKQCEKLKKRIEQLETMLNLKQEELELSEQINGDLGDRINQLNLELNGHFFGTEKELKKRLKTACLNTIVKQ